MRCKNCGKRLFDNDTFCPRCGENVDREDVSRVVRERQEPEIKINPVKKKIKIKMPVSIPLIIIIIVVLAKLLQAGIKIVHFAENQMTDKPQIPDPVEYFQCVDPVITDYTEFDSEGKKIKLTFKMKNAVEASMQYAKMLQSYNYRVMYEYDNDFQLTNGKYYQHYIYAYKSENELGKVYQTENISGNVILTICCDNSNATVEFILYYGNGIELCEPEQAPLYYPDEI